MNTVIAFVLALFTVVMQNPPRNLRTVLQEATDSGTVRWVQPQQANQVNPPITQYEWQALVDGLPVDSGTVPVNVRETRFNAPGSCGVEVQVSNRVRAINPSASWSPGPWGNSDPVARTRVCPVVPPLAPMVTTEIDTVAVSFPPPDQVLDLTHNGNHVLVWTQVNDGTGQPAKYDLRYGCPQLIWGAADTSTVVIEGTSIGDLIQTTVHPPNPPCDYRMVSFRGILNQSAVFGKISNMATVEPLVASPTTIRSGWELFERSSSPFVWDSTTFNTGEMVRLCWYMTGPDSTRVFGKWPPGCRDTLGQTSIPIYSDANILVRCREKDGTWTPLTQAPFDLNCADVAQWSADGIYWVEGVSPGALNFELTLRLNGGLE